MRSTPHATKTRAKRSSTECLGCSSVVMVISLLLWSPYLLLFVMTKNCVVRTMSVAMVTFTFHDLVTFAIVEK